MRQRHGIIDSRAVAASAIVSAFGDSKVDPANTATPDFTNMNTGAAAATRKLLAILSCRRVGGNTTINSCTIGGISATSVPGTAISVNIGGILNGMEFFIADVPLGTTATVAPIYDNVQLRSGCGLFQMVGAGSSTPHDTVTDSTGNPLTGLIDVPAGGALFGGCMEAGAAGAIVTWTGVTKQYDEVIESNIRHSGGNEDYASIQTDLSLEALFSVAPSSGQLMVGASFSP